MNADRFDGPYSNLCENPAPAVDSNDGEYSTAQVLRFKCHLCIQFFSRFLPFSFFVSRAVHRQRRRCFPRSRYCRFSHHVVGLTISAYLSCMLSLFVSSQTIRFIAMRRVNGPSKFYRPDRQGNAAESAQPLLRD